MKSFQQYSAYDFINSEVDEKHMKFGWKIEMQGSLLALSYTMLNFDWKSLEWLGEEGWSLFLASKSYLNFKRKHEKSLARKKRLLYHACSLSDLKAIVEAEELKVDVGKLMSKAIMKKSERIQEKIRGVKS